MDTEDEDMGLLMDQVTGNAVDWCNRDKAKSLMRWDEDLVWIPDDGEAEV